MEPTKEDVAEIDRLSLILAKRKDKVQWYGVVDEVPTGDSCLLVFSLFRISIYRRNFNEFGESFAQKNLIKAGHLFDLQSVAITRQVIANFTFGQFGSVSAVFRSERDLFACLRSLVILEKRFEPIVKFSFLGMTSEDVMNHFSQDLKYKDVERTLGSYEEVMSDAESIKYLRAHMTRAESLENLDFIEEWKVYKNSSGGRRRVLKNELFKRFFDKKAPYMLNIDHPTRKAIVEDIISKDPRVEATLYDEAHEAVQLLMRQDTYMKFLTSKEGKICAYTKIIAEEKSRFPTHILYCGWCSFFNLFPKESIIDMFSDTEEGRIEIKDYAELKVEFSKALVNTLKYDTTFSELLISRVLVKDFIKMLSEALLSNKTIKELRILSTRLEAGDVRSLSRNITNNVHNTIETLDFSHCVFTGKQFASLGSMLERAPVRELILVNCGGTPRTMPDLFESMAKNLLLHSTLQILDLSHNKFGYNASRTFTMNLMPNLRSLRKLHLRDTVFEVAELVSVVPFAESFAHLELADFSYNHVSTNASIVLSRFLSTLPKIKTMTLSSTGVRTSSMALVCSTLKNRGTANVELNLNHNKCKASEMRYLHSSLKGLDLSVLLISGMHIGASALLDLLDVLCIKRNLKVLDIGGNIRRSKCEESISVLQQIGLSLGRFENLTKLKLGWKDPLSGSDKSTKRYSFGNYISYVLDGLETSKTLSILDVSQNCISDAGFESLAGFIRRTSTLTSIRWGANDISLRSLLTMTDAIMASTTLCEFEIPKREIALIRSSQKGVNEDVISEQINLLRDRKNKLREGSSSNIRIPPNMKRMDSSSSLTSSSAGNVRSKPMAIARPSMLRGMFDYSDSSSPSTPGTPGVSGTRHFDKMWKESKSKRAQTITRPGRISDSSDDGTSGTREDATPQRKIDEISMNLRKSASYDQDLSKILEGDLGEDGSLTQGQRSRTLEIDTSNHSSHQKRSTFGFSSGIMRRETVDIAVDNETDILE